MKNEIEKFLELSFYTLSHHNSTYFIHQLAVDAFAAQTADEKTKPIKVIFALVGLYLVIEQGRSGRDAQLAHMRLAKNKGDWPSITLPVARGYINVADVLKTKEGVLRDEKIMDWCKEVWMAYSASHEEIRKLMRERLK